MASRDKTAMGAFVIGGLLLFGVGLFLMTLRASPGSENFQVRESMEPHALSPDQRNFGINKVSSRLWSEVNRLPAGWLPASTSATRIPEEIREDRQLGIRAVQLRHQVRHVHARRDRPRLRVLVPYDREGQGLRLHGVREEMNNRRHLELNFKEPTCQWRNPCRS